MAFEFLEINILIQNKNKKDYTKSIFYIEG